MVDRYVEAWERQDVDGIVGLLVADARFAMPPMATWYEGLLPIREALLGQPLRHRWRLLSTSANGQPALGYYRADDRSGRYRSSGLDVVTIRDGKIAEITAFQVDSLTPYGLPRDLPPITT